MMVVYHKTHAVLIISETTSVHVLTTEVNASYFKALFLNKDVEAIIIRN